LRALLAVALGSAASAGPSLARQEESQSPAAERQKEENEKSIPATHYVRELGPFGIDGRKFTVKLNVNCYKSSPHPGMCQEDDEEAVKSMKIVDQGGKTRFQESFPIGLMHQLERHTVDATLLEGSAHQALEVVETRLPSKANTGVTVQLFGVRNGALQPFNDDPLEFYGVLGVLPGGHAPNSKALLPGDTLPIYILTSYFYVISPVRLNWNDFELDQKDSGELEVVHQPPYGRKPDIEANGFVQLYSSPETQATATGVDVTPQSSIEVLKAKFRDGPPNEHDKPSDMWLEVSVDGRVGWIVGLDEYTALGINPTQ
jgi:hypothetical protein